MFIVLSLVFGVLALIAFLVGDRTIKKPIKNKRVLVIGGSSGLGFAIARLLYLSGNNITITSRTQKNLEKAIEQIKSEPKNLDSSNTNLPGDINGKVLDVLKDDSFINFEIGFDIIFCFPGFCIPKYFKDLEISDFEDQLEVNFLGVIRSLKYFRENNGKPFSFVAMNSTTSNFFFPGYSCYAPSKASLHAFFECANLELAREKIDLILLNCNTIETKGLVRENTCKPRYTREVEYSNIVYSVEDSARYFVENLFTRRVIAQDWFTYFSTIKVNCEKRIDYLMFPIAVLVIFVAKIIVKNKFKKYKIN